VDPRRIEQLHIPLEGGELLAIAAVEGKATERDAFLEAVKAQVRATAPPSDEKPPAQERVM
jgi:hypothetical protein